MIFLPTRITGTCLIEPEILEDDRGFFARTFCSKEFEDRGLKTRFVQSGISFNPKKGTLRGMHFQVAPHEEAKIVRCTRGAILDVLIDLREKSPTFGQWMGVQLSAENRRVLYVPEGVAHGFQTLVDGVEVSYQMSEFYEPACSRGVRWNDPAFRVAWPLRDPILSQRDRAHPLWQPHASFEIAAQETASSCEAGSGDSLPPVADRRTGVRRPARARGCCAGGSVASAEDFA